VSRMNGKNKITCHNWKTGEDTQHTIQDIQDPNMVDLWDSSVPSNSSTKGLRLLHGRVQLYASSQKDDLPDFVSKTFRNGQLEDRREYHPLLRGDVAPKTMELHVPSKPDRSNSDRHLLIFVVLLTLITMYFTQ
jgi:hypothetical protein